MGEIAVAESRARARPAQRVILAVHDAVVVDEAQARRFGRRTRRGRHEIHRVRTRHAQHGNCRAGLALSRREIARVDTRHRLAERHFEDSLPLPGGHGHYFERARPGKPFRDEFVEAAARHKVVARLRQVDIPVDERNRRRKIPRVAARPGVIFRVTAGVRYRVRRQRGKRASQSVRHFRRAEMILHQAEVVYVEDTVPRLGDGALVQFESRKSALADLNRAVVALPPAVRIAVNDDLDIRAHRQHEVYDLRYVRFDGFEQNFFLFRGHCRPPPGIPFHAAQEIVPAQADGHDIQRRISQEFLLDQRQARHEVIIRRRAHDRRAIAQLDVILQAGVVLQRIIEGFQGLGKTRPTVAHQQYARYRHAWLIALGCSGHGYGEQEQQHRHTQEHDKASSSGSNRTLRTVDF